MAEATSDVDHRQLGVDLYNYTWTLLEKEDRTRDDDDEMLNSTHASAYHWSRAAGPARRTPRAASGRSRA